MSPTPEAFFAACEAAFERAGAAAGGSETWLGLAGRVLRLRFAGAALPPLIEPAFRHLRRTAAARADFTVAIWDHDETGEAIPPRPWPPESEGVHGWVGGYGEPRFETCFQKTQVCMIDRARKRAIVWVRGAARLPAWDLIHPLRVLVFAWARGEGLHMIHAGAAGFGAAGILVVGPGGSGKSTTVLACIGAGGVAAGDDYVLVGDVAPPGDAAPLGDPAPFVAHSIYANMRLFRRHAEHFPGLLPEPDSEAPGHDGAPKFTSNVARHRPGRLVESLPIAAIVVPRIAAGGRTRALPEGGGAALMALAPSTLKQLDPRGQPAFALMSRLCRSLPCWRLELGADLAAVPDCVREIVARSAAPRAAASA